MIYPVFDLFFDDKISARKRKRRAEESPKMAVIVANLNIKKRSQKKNIEAKTILMNRFKAK